MKRRTLAAQGSDRADNANPATDEYRRLAR